MKQIKDTKIQTKTETNIQFNSMDALNALQHQSKPERRERQEKQEKQEKLEKLESSETRVRIISIEGIIGAGKSTLLKALKRHMGDSVLVVPECVDLWRALPDAQDPSQTHNLLDAYYQHRECAIQFQMFVLLTRAEALKKALCEAEKTKSIRFVLIERSSGGDACFVQLMAKQHIVSHAWASAYEHARGIIDSFLPPVDGYINLDVGTETSIKQIETRGRSEERCVTSDFQNALAEIITRWLAEERDRGLPILHLSADDVRGIGAQGDESESRSIKTISKQLQTLFS